MVKQAAITCTSTNAQKFNIWPWISFVQICTCFGIAELIELLAESSLVFSLFGYLIFSCESDIERVVFVPK